MICKACNYDSDKNESDSNYIFWQMTNINFQFERQEFTDVVEVLDGDMFLCPKCFTPQIVKTNITEKEIE
jgi:hypothetical protein